MHHPVHYNTAVTMHHPVINNKDVNMHHPVHYNTAVTMHHPVHYNTAVTMHHPVLHNTTHKLIKSYLGSRYQRVVLNNNSPDTCSNWGKITHGIPHVSILGPLLFLLYINDVPQTTNENSKTILYADDTSLIIANSNPTDF